MNIDLAQRDVFITSDNRRIGLSPDWFASKVWPMDIQSYQEFVLRVIVPQVSDRSSHEKEVYPKGFGWFLKKLITPEVIWQMLRESDVGFTKAKRMLDIGTGAAVIPRTLKLLGACGEAYGVDIQDRSGDLPDQKFSDIINFLQTNLLQDEKGSLAVDLLKRGDGMTTWTLPYGLLLDADLSRPFSMDGYAVSDFIAYESDGMTFDLIVTYSGICYFKFDDYFEKISELLEPGGIHYLMDTNFYHVYGESMELPMDAPWLHARVSKEDLFRYYAEKRPELAPYIEQGYFCKESHYTVRDVIERAKQYGLQALTYRRSYRQSELENFHYASGANLNFILTTALEDCRVLNPNVEMIDLLTQNWTIVFRKT